MTTWTYSKTRQAPRRPCMFTDGHAGATSLALYYRLRSGGNFVVALQTALHSWHAQGYNVSVMPSLALLLAMLTLSPASGKGNRARTSFPTRCYISYHCLALSQLVNHKARWHKKCASPPQSSVSAGLLLDRVSEALTSSASVALLPSPRTTLRI